MNNKEIMRKMCELYDPKTAFGNTDLLKLMKQIKIPNENGEFEIDGESVTKVIAIQWECANCGRVNIDDISYERTVKTKCKSCGAKHFVNLLE